MARACRAGVLPREGISAAAVVLVVLLSCGSASHAAAEDAGRPQAKPPEVVTFRFPDPIDIRELVAYVGTVLHLRVIYDEQLTGKVLLQSPTTVPVASLRDLLSVVLKTKGYALLEYDGWCQVTRVQKLTGETPLVPPDQRATGMAPVTAIVRLKHADVAKIVPVVTPMLSQPGGVAQGLDAWNLLVVTDFGANVRRVADLIDALDAEVPTLQMRVFPVVHSRPSTIEPLLKGVLTAFKEARVAAGAKPLPAEPHVIPNDQTGELLVVATDDVLAAVAQVIGTLDANTDRVARSYTLTHRRAEQVVPTLERLLAGLDERQKATLIRTAEPYSFIAVAAPGVHDMLRDCLRLLDVAGDSLGTIRIYPVNFITAEELRQVLTDVYRTGAEGPLAQILVIPGANSLLALAPDSEQGRLTNLIAQLDRKPAVAMREVRFYPVQHADAQEVAGVIRTLLQEGGTAVVPASASTAAPTPSPSMTGGASIRPEEPVGAAQASAAAPAPSGATAPSGAAAAGTEAAPAERPAGTGGVPAAGATAAATTRPELGKAGATIAVDVNTNTLIVNAPRSVHALVEAVLARLDRRRAQVLIEARIVEISYSDSFSLGIELESNRLGADKPALYFTNFGLSSEIDPATGKRQIATKGRGLGTSIVAGKDLDVILRALETQLKARVVACPQILVSDNETAYLRNVNEQPYITVETVNQVTTTAFGGYAEAGTYLEVKPHVTPASHVRLGFAVNRSSFGQGTTGNVPPPREANELRSEVGVPDGAAVIVAVVTDARRNDAVTGVPIVGRIPLLGTLFRSTDRSSQRLAVYVFLRVQILRDDAFEDLKWISRRYLEESGVIGAGTQEEGVAALFPETPPERMIPALAGPGKAAP